MTFFVHGISVSELQQAQELLVPLLGNGAAYVFAVALLFVGIAFTATAGMAGVTIFSGMFGESCDMKDIHSRVGLLLTFIPAVIVLYFINDPFWGLIVSQMLLSVLLRLTVFMQIWLLLRLKLWKLMLIVFHKIFTICHRYNCCCS